MTKRAFVVGINDYQNWQSASSIRFPSLQYCCADAEAFAGLLTTNLGFDPADVLLCENAEATLTSILSGVNNLLSQSQPGDVACVYFAGHGGCVPEEGWGAASNRYYQSIVPYDGAGMIFDEQISAIAQSALASGVNLTIVLDTAHAGQIDQNAMTPGTRGFGWNTDMQSAFISKAKTIIPLIGVVDPSILENNISSPQRSAMGVTMTIDPAKNWVETAQAVLLSACDFNQMASENSNQGHGLLTGALLSVLGQSANVQMTHDALLKALQDQVSSVSGGRQLPQFRGRRALQGVNFLNN